MPPVGCLAFSRRLPPCQVKEQNAFARSAVSGFRKSVIFAKSLRRPMTQT